MPSINMAKGVITILSAGVLACVPATSWAQQPPATVTTPRGPFDGGGGFGVEFGGGLAGEAWNSNGSQEWLADGTMAIWWGFKRSQAIVAAFHGTSIFQDRPRTAFVNAFVPGYRWRIVQGQQTDLFAEVGLGVSWSDTTTPPRGTRFNFFTVFSVGASRRLTNQTQFVTTFRWFHLSNASRFGRDRNPDIEALGAYAGFLIGF